jgi:hypothetical protein
MACERQSTEMVDIFLELGAASIEMADPHGATPLLVAVAAAASDHAFVQHLLGLGASPHAACDNGRDALNCVLRVLFLRCRWSCRVSCAVRRTLIVGFAYLIAHVQSRPTEEKLKIMSTLIDVVGPVEGRLDLIEVQRCVVRRVVLLVVSWVPCVRLKTDITTRQNREQRITSAAASGHQTRRATRS